MTSFLKKHSIQQYHTFSKNKVSPVERGIQTLKQKIYRYLTHTGKKEWLSVLNSFANQINSSYHRTIKTTPQSVTPETESEVWFTLYSDLVMRPKLKPKFAVNDLVKISIAKLIFDRGFTVNWSDSTYKIKKVNIHPDIVTYILEDLNKEELQGSF